MENILLERASKVRKSFKFGDKVISPNVFLSPMSGVTDYPFRKLIVQLAARRTGMFVSEFISVDGMTRLIPKVCRHMRFDPDQFADEMRLAAAAVWYEQGKVSQELAARIAGLSRTDFLITL